MSKDLAKYIDHTLLKPEASEEAILAICEEAKELRTASVCVNGCWAKTVREALKGSGVKTCCVIGFPLGAMSTAAKAFEAAEAAKDGAEEIDMVQNIGWLKSKRFDDVRADIEAVVKAASAYGAIVKVIIETCLLTEEEKIISCRLAKEARAAFVKTSTGFSKAGATVPDVALMRETVGPEMGVKAAGGIHSREEAEAMIAAGAARIGASATRAILNG